MLHKVLRNLEDKRPYPFYLALGLPGGNTGVQRHKQGRIKLTLNVVKVDKNSWKQHLKSKTII